jgi:hypothetical protein
MRDKLLLFSIILILLAVSVSADPLGFCDCPVRDRYTCDDDPLNDDFIYQCICDSCPGGFCDWQRQTDCLPGEQCEDPPGPQGANCGACTPYCPAGYCGDNGCGASCGLINCTAGQTCYLNHCCSRNCTGKTCGPDGCGGTCPPNNCGSGNRCYNGNCCTPFCPATPGYCGDDTCGGICPATCAANNACDYITHRCDILVTCNPECSGDSCTDSDGCGGTCDSCGLLGQVCYGTLCVPPGLPHMCESTGNGGNCEMTHGSNYVYQLDMNLFPCTMNAGADTIGMCVACEYYYGETCSASGTSYECNPNDLDLFGNGVDCEEITNYTCIDNHCCRQGEFWDWANGICAKKVCILEGGVTTNASECCKTPFVPKDLYLDGTHCCPLGSVWSVAQSLCLPADPCYFYDQLVYNTFCKSGPPNFPLRYQVGWWSSMSCINSTSRLACCYNGSGYGYSEWYISSGITVY